MVEQSLALVTGAAHRLGRTFALTLAQHKFAIIVHYHLSKNEAESTADEIRKFGVPVFLIKADLTKPEEINGLFSFIDGLDGRLKILVNSAAEILKSKINDVSIEKWDENMDLNLRAPFFLSQQAAKRMTQGSLIVNVTDAGVTKAWTGFATYMIGKSGLEMMTRILAKALAPSIRVNAIAPGLVLPSESIMPEYWEKLVKRLPLQRPVDLDDVSAALEFLLQVKSLTGQTIVVDGGYSLL
jgi:NAD(P)-dependent dehydrogenase (short-subunit alcohol dehydrogenase family)